MRLYLHTNWIRVYRKIELLTCDEKSLTLKYRVYTVEVLILQNHNALKS